MADSNITCSGLTATSGVGQIALRWETSDPNAGGLPYLTLETVEVWASTTNDRLTSSKIAEGLQSALHVGVPEEASRFYWVRPRSRSGVYGEWFPISASAGVQGVSATAKLIRAGTIIGSTIKTAEVGPRLELSAGTGLLRGYGDDFGESIGILVPVASTPDDTPVVYIYGRPGIRGMQVTSDNKIAINGITFGSAAAIEGWNRGSGFDFYARRNGYGPFTGVHEGLWPKHLPLPQPGDVICDDRVLFSQGVSNAICTMRFAERAAEPATGVFVSASPGFPEVAAFPDDLSPDALREIEDRWVHILFNGVGEGLINVSNAHGPIAAGDLLIAGGAAGKAVAQADDVLRASTIARARQAADFDGAGVAQIACIYLSG